MLQVETQTISRVPLPRHYDAVYFRVKDFRQMPELERWVLHRLTELDEHVRGSIEDFDFHAMFTALHNFCATELSAFYLDIRKDSLYCDAAGSHRRRSARTVF